MLTKMSHPLSFLQKEIGFFSLFVSRKIDNVVVVAVVVLFVAVVVFVVVIDGSG